MLIPSTVQPPSTSSEDLRLGHLILKPSNQGPRIVLIGFPSDEGVRRNGGRVGAAEAPDLIRKSLYKLTPDPLHFEGFSRLLDSMLDAGNVHVTGNVEVDQQNLSKLVAEWLAKGAIPIVLGGGHETAYGHFLGYVENNSPVKILNVDAHADVRPLKEGQAHSGSPFFQALEHASGLCKDYTVQGLVPWSVSRAHIEYLDSRGCTYRWMKKTTRASLEDYFVRLNGPAMVTLDMDVVDQRSAPGVSAPATTGLPLTTFYHAAYLAGRSPKVTSLDLVEVNPIFDIDHQTARAAAVTIWHFLKGVSERVG